MPPVSLKHVAYGVLFAVSAVYVVYEALYRPLPFRSEQFDLIRQLVSMSPASEYVHTQSMCTRVANETTCRAEEKGADSRLAEARKYIAAAEDLTLARGSVDEIAISLKRAEHALQDYQRRRSEI